MWRLCVVCAPLCAARSGQLNCRCAPFVSEYVYQSSERKNPRSYDTLGNTLSSFRTDARAVVREGYPLACQWMHV